MAENPNEQFDNLNKKLYNLNRNVSKLSSTIDSGFDNVGKSLKDLLSVGGFVGNIASTITKMSEMSASMSKHFGVAKTHSRAMVNSMYNAQMGVAKYNVSLENTLDIYLQIGALTRNKNFSGLEDIVGSASIASKTFSMAADDMGDFLAHVLLYSDVSHKTFENTIFSLKDINADLTIIGDRISESSRFMSMFNIKTEAGNRRFKEMIKYSSVVNKNVEEMFKFSDQFRFFGESNDMTSSLMQAGIPVDPMQMMMASYGDPSEIRRYIMNSMRSTVGNPKDMSDPYVKNMFMLLGRTLGEDYIDVFEEFTLWNKYAHKDSKEAAKAIARDNMSITQKLLADIMSILTPFGRDFAIVFGAIGGWIREKTGWQSLSLFKVFSDWIVELRKSESLTIRILAGILNALGAIASLLLSVVVVGAGRSILSKFAGSQMGRFMLGDAVGNFLGNNRGARSTRGSGFVTEGRIAALGPGGSDKGTKQFSPRFTRGMGMFWNVLKGMLGAGVAIGVLAGSLYLLSKSFEQLAKIEWNNIDKGKSVIFGMTSGLLGLIAAMTMLLKTPGGIKVAAIGAVGTLGVVGVFAGSIHLLAGAFQQLGKANFGNLTSLGSGLRSIGSAMNDVSIGSTFKSSVMIDELGKLGVVSTLYGSKIKDLGIGLQNVASGIKSMSSIGSAMNDVSIGSTFKSSVMIDELGKLGVVSTLYGSKIKDLGIGLQNVASGIKSMSSEAVNIDGTTSMVKTLSQLNIGDAKGLFNINVIPQEVRIELDGDTIGVAVAKYNTRVQMNRR